MKVRSGIDTVHIPRIEREIERHGEAFVNRCYTDAEKEYVFSHKSVKRQAEILAGRFAAKEAVSKALGTGILAEGISLTEMEIVSDSKGAPELVLYGRARSVSESLNVISASVSITHENEYAAAVCVLLCDEEI